MDSSKYLKMENKTYSWFVKKGNITLQKNTDQITLQLNYEEGKSCLLTSSDVEEITDILFNLAQKVWENPNYIRKPYTEKLYKNSGNVYSWNIETSELVIHFNEEEKAVEIKSTGKNILNLEVNQIVEIVQILEYINQ